MKKKVCSFIWWLAIAVATAISTHGLATAAAPAPTGSQITAFNLTSPAGGTQPFTVGLGLKKGDIAGTPTLNIPNSQVMVMRRWNDGSVKHAIASGHADLAGGTALAVGVYNAAAAAAGTVLTAADIRTASPQASISFGSYGTVDLSSLLASPFRTFISGPEMVEAHYRTAVGTDPTLVAWFHVRLYKSGKVWIRAIGENGYLDVTNANKSYVPTVQIGGTQVWNNGGTTLTHYSHTRWTQEGWIGGDPQISPRHDTAYLKASRLVPNLMLNTPDAATLNSLYQTYAPNQNGGWTMSMGDTGYQEQIGLLPQWDSLFVTSGADARAYRSVIANSKALNSYPIVWNDSVTKIPLKPTDRASWSTDGANGGGSSISSAGPLSWEIAHHGSGGYLAYLITGDYYHLETMQGQSALGYLMAGSVNWTGNPPSPNLGTSRYLNGQTRGYAWVLRTLSQYVGIAPSADALLTDYSALLANNILRLKAIKDTVNPPGIGYLYEYNASLSGVGIIPPWQQHFFIQTLGMGSDLEPLSDMSAYIGVRDYMYRAAVGILGDSTGYCFTEGGFYLIKSNDGTGGGPNTWYKTWAQVYAATYAVPPPCGNTLHGNSGGDPAYASTGYWGNLIPAIAYAVDHGAAGAAQSWARLTGASNWSTILNSGFNNNPQWGVIPRGTVTPPSPDTTPDTFNFSPQTGAAVNTEATSNIVIPTGFNAAAAISIIGGSYSINGGAFVTAVGTISPGQSVAVRQTSSSTPGTTTSAALTIGGVAATFAVTTQAVSGIVVTIGERNTLPTADDGNGNLLFAQSANLAQSATIQSLSFYVTNAAGNLRLGIYDATGPGGGPGAKKAETQQITPITGWNTSNVVTPVLLPSGVYWLAYLPSSNSLAFRKTDDATSTSRWYPVTFGVMPATFSTMPNASASHWSFYATLITANVSVVPSAPTGVSAKPSIGGVVVQFTGYTATCVSGNGGILASNTANAGATSIRVNGLTYGKSYTCTVTASSSGGSGAASTPSDAVTPFDLSGILYLLLQD
jgi:hypothetical protein